MRAPRMLIGAVTSGVLAVFVVATPAVAAPAVFVERYEFSDSGTFDDCGFEIRFDDEARGRISIRQAPGSTEAFLGHDTFRYRTTFTNTDTGEWFVQYGHGLFREVSGTLVEGTIYRFVANESGQPFVIEDMHGNVVVRNRGVTVFEVLFDTLGDGQPGGEVLEEGVLHVHGPHAGLELDFCDIARDLIG